MAKLQEQLKSISKNLVSLSKQLDRVTKQVAKLSAPKKKKAAPKKAAAKKKPAKRAAKKAPAKKAAAGQATVLDTVLDVVKRSRNGASIAKLKEKTKLESRQLSNALYKLSKRGLIKAKSRGLYIKA
jgi:predicted Rossmann fold nucleotide-binding protein DprA/Smf involved in DNA uptake